MLREGAGEEKMVYIFYPLPTKVILNVLGYVIDMQFGLSIEPIRTVNQRIIAWRKIAFLCQTILCYSTSGSGD